MMVVVSNKGLKREKGKGERHGENRLSSKVSIIRLCCTSIPFMINMMYCK